MKALLATLVTLILVGCGAADQSASTTTDAITAATAATATGATAKEQKEAADKKKADENRATWGQSDIDDAVVKCTDVALESFEENELPSSLNEFAEPYCSCYLDAIISRFSWDSYHNNKEAADRIIDKEKFGDKCAESTGLFKAAEKLDADAAKTSE